MIIDIHKYYFKMIGVFRYVNNLRNISNKDFWTSRTVTLNKKFSSREESLKYLNWRNSQYLLYEELMPCSGFDDKIILDYGCGPGNDLVGFLEFSQPKRLVGMDISKTALQEAQERLSLHESNLTELIQIEDGAKKLPFPDNTFDYIHSSGVLHHTPNMEEILSEFYRILKPDGKIRIMVYNYNSIWLHLSVAYQKRILQKIDSDVSLEEAFKRSTDGGLAPISRCYKKEDFIKICTNLRFKAKYLGAAIYVDELFLLPLRYKALKDLRADEEQRNFLKKLTFDNRGLPLYDGDVAGIDSVYELTK